MDDLDELLRSAADDLRTETVNIPAPDFAPRRSGSRVVAGSAILLLALGAFAGVRSLTNSDGGTIDQAAGRTTPTTEAVEPPDQNRDATRPLTPDPVDLGSLLRHGDPVPYTEIEAPEGIGRGEWTEPDFGTPILRLTAMENGGVTAPLPSSTQSFNADGSAFLLYRATGEGGTHVLFDRRTLQEIGPVEMAVRDAGDFSWHPSDPNLLYFPDRRSNKLIETNVRSNVSRSATTFDSCDRVDQGLTAGSTAGTTGFLGLLCHRGDQAFPMVHDLALGQTVIASQPTEQRIAPVAASPDGTLFVAVEENQVVVLDGDLSPTPISPIPEDVNRYALQLDGDTGDPLLVISSYDTDQGPGLAIVFNLVTGVRRGILSEDAGDGFPPSDIGLAASSETGLVAAISRTPEPDNTRPWFGEIVLIDPSADNTYRLGRHRMSSTNAVVGGGTAHVAISPDATLLLFSSDWGTGDAVDTYAIPLAL